jgi:SulP family sulfate permease
LDEKGVKHYEMYRPLIYGSITAISKNFEVLTNPEEVIIDFAESRVVDMSAIKALNKITQRYHKVGKKVHLRHLSPDCKKLLAKADEIIDINIIEEPTDRLLKRRIGLKIPILLIARN